MLLMSQQLFTVNLRSEARDFVDTAIGFYPEFKEGYYFREFINKFE